MADADKDQKTEEPTTKRLEDARKRGEVATAPEMRHATMMIGALVVAGWLGANMLASMATLFRRLWGDAQDFRIDADGAQGLMTGIAMHTAWALAPIFALLMVCAMATAFLQGRVTMSWSRLAPKWSKLDPFSGLKRMFGQRALVEFLKTLAKFAAIVMAVLVVLRPRLAGFDQLVGFTPSALSLSAGTLMFEAVRAVVMVVVLLAGADFVYQRYAFRQRMRMTLQEVKDEHKQSEGDPKIKARIRQIQMQRARKRMMAQVPTASVIITNPTHYAVALKYDHGAMQAPVVVAKGVDAVALKIREIAKEAGVPIVESPPLARALHASVEVDRPISVEHYAAVAEIISYVLKLARRSAVRA